MKETNKTMTVLKPAQKMKAATWLQKNEQRLIEKKMTRGAAADMMAKELEIPEINLNHMPHLEEMAETKWHGSRSGDKKKSAYFRKYARNSDFLTLIRDMVDLQEKLGVDTSKELKQLKTYLETGHAQQELDTIEDWE